MHLKTLIYFIDGGTWKLLDKWVAEGELPHFAALMREGARAKLQSVLPPTTHTALPAFFSGRQPGDLNLLTLDEVDAALLTSDKFSPHFFWERLSEKGFSSLIMDIPFTFPPKPFDGVLFTGFYTPKDSENFVYPPEKAKVYPNYPRGGVEIFDHMKLGFDFDELLEAEYDITRARFKAFERELTLRKFDLACFYVKGTDILQHFLWDQKDRILQYYRMLDNQIGTLRENHDIENFVLLSDHGFADAPTETFFINAWLAQEGYLSWKPTCSNPLRRAGTFVMQRYRPLARFVYQMMHRIKGSPSSQKASSSASQTGFEISGGIDLSKSRAYAIGGTLRGKGIVINRDLVNEDDVEALREEIIAGLSKATHLSQPITQSVLRSEDCAEDASHLPDILFLQAERFIVNDRYSSTTIGKRMTNSRAKGHHLASPDGVFVWHGANVQAKKYDEFSILDIYPTILYLYGISDHGGSGRVLKELYE